MTARLLPVLFADDPALALEWFGLVPGLGVDRERGRVVCGEAEVMGIPQGGASPEGFRRKPFDHLAFRVGDVDGIAAAMLAAGAALDPRFTPAGPVEIGAFWERGVRYAFFIGPGGVPVEFCQRLLDDPGPPEVTGLDHLGLRCPDVEAETADLLRSGAEMLARHRLDGAAGSVNVRFLGQDGVVWELFDEAPLPVGPVTSAWAGVVPA